MSTWACSACTLINNPGASKCSICGTARPQQQLQVGGGPVGLRLFQSLDSTRAGQISWQQFLPAIQRVGWTPEQALAMWYDTDKDRSGTVDQNEFLQFAGNPTVRPYIERMEAQLPVAQAQPFPAPQFSQPFPAPQVSQAAPGARLFDFMDGKGGEKDGKIVWTEFLPMIKAAGWSEQVASKMWYDVDTSRAGFLDRAKWLRFCAHPDVQPHIVKLEAHYCGPAPLVQQQSFAGYPPSAGLYPSAGAPGKLPAQVVQQTGFASTCTGAKKAVLIGINYKGSSSELRGCVNDVLNLRRFIQSQFGFRDQNIVQLTDDTRDPKRLPTHQNIISALQWLVQGAQPGDSLFLHYSGHGGSVRDQNGDEEDGMDETILPLDFQRSGEILDDTLHDILVKPLRPGVRLTCIFDSCHSGSVMDLPFSYTISGDLQITMVDNRKKAMEAGGAALQSLMFGNELGFLVHGVTAIGHLMSKPNTEAKAKAEAEKRTDADVIQFSGCRDDQTSADASIGGQATGAMSWAFIKVLSGGRQLAYTQLLAELRQVLYGKYSQVPQMSSGRPMDMKQLFVM